MTTDIKETKPTDWKYISEGGSSIVFSYIGPSNPQFDGTALRLRKIDVNAAASISDDDGQEDPDDPTIVFQHKVIERLVSPAYLPRLDAVKVSREWLQELSLLVEDKRPNERRAKDKIDISKRKAVLATDLVGGNGWAVEIKPKWGFLPSATHLSPLTVPLKTRTCRFCMHASMKAGEGEDVSLGYCPLDLYSSDPDRVKKALHSLWDVWIKSSGSVNNLKVFVEGRILKPTASGSSLDPLAKQILPEDAESYEEEALRDAFVAQVLPLLMDTPVLKTLSTHQKNLDILDVEGLSMLWKQANKPLGSDTAAPIPILGYGLEDPTIHELQGFLDVYTDKHETLDHDHPDVGNLRYYCLAYLLSASFKDCSIILRLPPVAQDSSRKPSITVIDLDVKSVDRLPKWEKLDQKILKAYAEVAEPTLCVV